MERRPFRSLLGVFDIGDNHALYGVIHPEVEKKSANDQMRNFPAGFILGAKVWKKEGIAREFVSAIQQTSLPSLV